MIHTKFGPFVIGRSSIPEAGLIQCLLCNTKFMVSQLEQKELDLDG